MCSNFTWECFPRNPVYSNTPMCILLLPSFLSTPSVTLFIIRQSVYSSLLGSRDLVLSISSRHRKRLGTLINIYRILEYIPRYWYYPQHSIKPQSLLMILILLLIGGFQIRRSLALMWLDFIKEHLFGNSLELGLVFYVTASYKWRTYFLPKALVERTRTPSAWELKAAAHWGRQARGLPGHGAAAHPQNYTFNQKKSLEKMMWGI